MAAVPGVVGLLGAVALLLVGEQRYARTLEHVEARESPLDHRLVRITTVAIVVLAGCAVGVLLVTAP